MSAVEEIEAAIAKLNLLRDSSTLPPWRVTYESTTHPRVWGNCDESDADHVATMARSAHDAELIVTLHRTIDAQLAILAMSLRYEKSSIGTGSAEDFHRHVIALARSINGVTS